MEIKLDLDSPESYQIFLKVKSLPRYRFQGRIAIIPDEYCHLLGIDVKPVLDVPYEPLPGLFDYQADLARIAIRREKFCVFADPGMGKTLIDFEFARHVVTCLPEPQAVLIICPLMVVDQMIREAQRFYGDSLPIERIPARELPYWTIQGKGRIGITNYEALSDKVQQGRIGGLILVESSMMKSEYGVWGQHCIRLGKGLRWKLAETGTPAPNDRKEYGNHAIFMDAFPTLNSFLSKFFVNRGQTQNRWEMKPHAIEPFYRSLSDWCIFLTNPATYGWKDNVGGWPPINVHIHDIDLTAEQNSIAREMNGTLFPMHVGGITKRGKAAQLANGVLKHKGKPNEAVETNKFKFIRSLIDSFNGQSCIVWCRHDDEQDRLEKIIPEAASLRGRTPQPKRIQAIADFQSGKVKVMVSKPRILGLGLNLQVARHQIITPLDSYEEWRQCIGRSNRYGSTEPLDVHIPCTELERPMIENTMRKADRVQQDAAEQERIFQGSVAGGAFHASA